MADWYAGICRFGVTVQVKQQSVSANKNWASRFNNTMNNQPGSVRTSLNRLKISGGAWLSRVSGTIVKHATVQESLGRRNSWRDHWRYHTATLNINGEDTNTFYVSVACDHAELGSDKPGEHAQVWRTIKAWDKSGGLVLNTGRELLLKDRPYRLGRKVINYERNVGVPLSKVEAYIEYYVGSNKWHNWKNDDGKAWEGYEPGTTLDGYHRIPMSQVNFKFDKSVSHHEIKTANEIQVISFSS